MVAHLLQTAGKQALALLAAGLLLPALAQKPAPDSLHTSPEGWLYLRLPETAEVWWEITPNGTKTDRLEGGAALAGAVQLACTVLADQHYTEAPYLSRDFLEGYLAPEDSVGPVLPIKAKDGLRWQQVAWRSQSEEGRSVIGVFRTAVYQGRAYMLNVWQSSPGPGAERLLVETLDRVSPLAPKKGKKK